MYCAKRVHLLISLYFLWPGVFCDTVCVIDPERVIHTTSVFCVLGVNWFLQQRQQGRQSRGYHHECLVRCDWGVSVWESDSANLDLREIRLGCLAWGDLTHDLFDQYRNSEFETVPQTAHITSTFCKCYELYKFTVRVKFAGSCNEGSLRI